MKLILSAAQDPGGAEAISPVLKALRTREDVSLTVLATRQAGEVFSKHGVAYDDAEGWDESRVKDAIGEAKPSLIFTATSHG